MTKKEDQSWLETGLIVGLRVEENSLLFKGGERALGLGTSGGWWAVWVVCMEGPASNVACDRGCGLQPPPARAWASSPCGIIAHVYT